MAAHKVDGQRVREGHPAIAEQERPVELLNRPQCLRPELVRQVGAVLRIARDDQGEGQPELLGIVPVEDGREAVERGPVERMGVPFPRAARGVRLREQPGQALLLDDEARVEPSEFERHPSVDRAGRDHGSARPFPVEKSSPVRKPFRRGGPSPGKEGSKLAASNICPKCGFMNQAGWTFCPNCGSPAAMAGGMPPAGGAPTPPPASPAYPGYGYGASPWEADRQKGVRRTKTRLLLLLIGALLSWIPFGISLLGALLLLIGAIFVILGRKAFGAGHSRNVVLAIVLFFVRVIGTIILGGIFVGAIISAAGCADPAVLAHAFVRASNTRLIGVIVVSAISGIGSVLFTYALQQQIGKILLWAGYAANVAIAIAVYAIISPLFAAAFTQATSGGTYDPGPLLAVQSQATALVILSVIPSVLFAAATYLAWSRVNRVEIPAPSCPPGMPTMTPPPGGASPPM